MRLPRSLLSRFFFLFLRGRLFCRSLFSLRALTGLCFAGSSWSCTLITDVDREKIPVPVQPAFPEVDAGPQPPLDVADASADASAPGDAADASDAGAEPSDAADDTQDSGGDAG